MTVFIKDSDKEYPLAWQIVHSSMIPGPPVFLVTPRCGKHIAGFLLDDPAGRIKNNWDSPEDWHGWSDDWISGYEYHTEPLTGKALERYNFWMGLDFRIELTKDIKVLKPLRFKDKV